MQMAIGRTVLTMDRLTTNKPVGEMTMTELAHNGCYRGEDGWARYRDYDTDIDARVLAGKLLKRYEPEQPLSDEGRALEDLLFDELQYGPLDHAGALVALVYNMIWSMADLRECLAAYENTGLEPKEITEYLNATDEYVRASEEGRLIVLPCKVGDTVYKPFLRPLSVVPMTVRRIVIDGIDNQIIVDGGRSFCFCDIGRTVFLTRERAEAALGGGGDDHL